LAKELNVDSKALVDMCAKAGVTGKGSALASLTDEEVEKVRAFIAGGQQRQSEKKPPARPPTTPVPVLHSPAPSPAATPAPEAPAPAVEPPQVTPASAPAARPLSTHTNPTVAASATTGERSGVLTRESAYSGRGTQKEIRVLGRPKRDENRGGGEEREKRKGPLDDVAKVKLAPVPAANQPMPPPKAKDSPAQKPTIRLPKDAIQHIQKGKPDSGGRLDQIRKAAESKRTKDKDKKDVAVPGRDAATKDKARRGDRGRPAFGEEDAGPRGLGALAEQRAARQKLRKLRPDGTLGDDETVVRARGPRRPRQPHKGPAQNTAAPRKEKVTIKLPCTIREFSEAAGVSATNVVLRRMLEMGIRTTINGMVDFATAEQLMLELDLQNVELQEATSLEDEVLSRIRSDQDAPESLEERPPVVTVLGHVDHGKTSLLDKIIGLDVVSGEAGGITQHIRAYNVKKDGRSISFVDTPGHEAFTEMRARGANVTDIAVLVVAADDGVMPQTEEAISHAKAAEVPIVVAMNKIDLPGANPDRVLQQLAAHELLPAEWGGDVEVVKTSAITGEGVDKLLETLLLTADIHEYKANPNRDAFGVCLEAEQEPGRGVLAKIMVKNGTLNVGDIVVCGAAHGRVKAMFNTLRTNKKLKSAGPSIPATITGLDVAPQAGDTFYVLKDITQARELAARRAEEQRRLSLAPMRRHTTFEEFQAKLAAGTLAGGDEPAVLNIILRADVRGSIEAIQKELSKLEHPEVKIRILQASVGGITVGDVTLAAASDAVIVGFNVIPDEDARSLAEEKGVEIRRYDIIYRVTSDIKDMLEGKLSPEEQVKDIGRALVKQIFTISRIGTIAGCHVLDGVIQRGCRIRVNREGRGIGDYPLDSLRREKDDAREVRKGYECGIKLAGFNDLKEGDILEAYLIEEVKRELIPVGAGSASN
jgi:translation initiation factor IF-2